jgi:hypothetical protein
MQHQIVGSTMPVLEVQLAPDESIVAVSGELSWMTSAISLSTTTQFGGGGGFLGAFKRVVGGGSLFMTEYKAVGGPGSVAFAAKLPGHILPVEVTAGRVTCFIAMASFAPHRESSWGSVFSSPWELASLAAKVFSCKSSKANVRLSSSWVARSSTTS